MPKPFQMEVSLQQTPSQIITAIVQVLKQHPEGMDVKLGENTAPFRRGTVVQDIINFWSMLEQHSKQRSTGLGCPGPTSPSDPEAPVVVDVDKKSARKKAGPRKKKS